MQITCEICNKEPATIMILDTYAVPRHKQLIMHVGIDCIKKAIHRRLTDPYYEYLGWYLILTSLKNNAFDNWLKDSPSPYSP